MRVTLDGPLISKWGMGGFRKSALIDSWVFVPPIEKLGKSNGRTRDQLTVGTEKFYRAETRLGDP
jgi:hypothetical protein